MALFTYDDRGEQVPTDTHENASTHGRRHHQRGRLTISRLHPSQQASLSLQGRRVRVRRGGLAEATARDQIETVLKHLQRSWVVGKDLKGPESGYNGPKPV